MDKLNFDLDESAVLRRFDRSSPDALLKSIAREILSLRRAQAELAAKMEVFGSLQAAADRIAAAESDVRGASAPSRVVVDAAQSFQGSTGFHELEHDPDGQPFRWTGPEPRFSFEFFIDRRRPAKFMMRFGPLFSGGSPVGLLCFVDGEPTPVKLQAATTCFEAVGVLPPRPEPGGSVLSFVCPSMASPAAQGLADSRMLGLLFRRLTVETALEPQTVAAPPQPAAEVARTVARPAEPAPPPPAFQEPAFQEISFKGPAR